MKIDSHQHFWKYDPVRDSWIDTSMKVIRRDFMPEDLQEILVEQNFEGCVAVQADQSLEETKFLLQLANDYSFIKGVVGWVDLCDPSVGGHLDHLSKNKTLKGIRHILQSESDDFMLSDAFCNGISQLEKHQLTYDILIYHGQLKNTIAFVEKFPNQKFVLDHIGKPDIKSNKITNWERELTRLAKYPNVFCKVSGMVTEADWENWNENDFTTYLDVVFKAFGTHRVLYGSDWPVCLLAGNYNSVLSIVKNYIKQFSEEEQEMIMGKNTIDFYSL